MSKVTHVRLLELLNYDSVTGVFTRRLATTNRVKVGDVAGTKCNEYILISVDNKRYYAHVLAWFYHYQVWPTHELDHEDRNGAHNAIDNLRESDRYGNMANVGKPSCNTSGYKGVFKSGAKYKASITSKGTQLYLGTFSDPVAAANAYDQAAIQHFGQFAATNRGLGLL